MNNKLVQFINNSLRNNLDSKEGLLSLKRKFSKDHKVEFLSNNNILRQYRQMVKNKTISKNTVFERLLRIREIRTLSGIASVGVHTKAFTCPGKCIYCPNEKNMPKSYLSTQPAVIRSINQNFDPYKMVRARLKAYYANGHSTDKCELIVMGGTWSYHNPLYQIWFLKRCFDAFNSGHDGKIIRKNVKEPYFTGNQKKNGRLKIYLLKKLLAAQKTNEKAACRVVGLTLETRPDYITKKEVVWMRILGATRVELGVQSIFNNILKLNKRGHNAETVIRATKLLKNAGLKITYHIMPGLYGSNRKKDLELFQNIFNNPDFIPDQIKIYPTIVTKHTKLYELWKNGVYRPYSDNNLKALLKQIKLLCPPYIRIARLFRDIPGQSIAGGSKITNIRQIIQQEMNKDKLYCRCLRCREARGKSVDIKSVRLTKLVYSASEGKEMFLSYESSDRNILYAFCRLRFPDKKQKSLFSALNSAAIVRELHTYGELTPFSDKKGKIQHSGFGKLLMQESEKQAKLRKYKKISVISGIGVRGYYRKLGYKLRDTYMIKTISE